MSRLVNRLRHVSASSLRERGVTVVEYSLVVSLVLVGSVSSLEGMDGELEKHYNVTATDIGQASSHSFDVSTTTVDPNTTTTTTTTSTTSTTVPPSSSTTSTTTSTTTTTTSTTTTTTTTAPPTTTSTTTSTTTAPPTTTTTPVGPPPTTTVPAAETTTIQRNNWSGYYGNYWKWSVYGRMRLRDEQRNNLSNATVNYTVTLDTGEQQSFTGTTDSRGRLIVDWSFHQSDDIFPAVITVTSVSRSGEDYNPSPAQWSWRDTNP